MILREYRPADADALAEVYRDAVLVLGPHAYTEDQIRVWAMHPEDTEEFRHSLSAGVTLCALVDDEPVAFGQLNPVNHLAYLYCASNHARRGFASRILRKLEAHARAEGVATLELEASCVARPFFEHHGYRVVEDERVIRHGVEFLRFKMRKDFSG